jgi:hypothetical protein
VKIGVSKEPPFLGATPLQARENIMPKEPTRELGREHIWDLARLEGTAQMLEAGARVSTPSWPTTVKLWSKFSKYLLDREAPAPDTPPPPPVLEKIELDTGYIAFSGGVPVGGYSHLSLFPNGAFSFTGHFHVSGAPSYDTQLVWVVLSSGGTALTFSHKGRVHGTFEAGSRDDDWGDSGTNPALAAAWADISLGYSWRWSAGVNLDLGSMLDQAVKTVGQVATVVAIVA